VPIQQQNYRYFTDACYALKLSPLLGLGYCIYKPAMLNLQTDWDRPYQLASQSGDHILRIRLTPTNNGQRTLPLHLAITLDTSQSMQGEKLEAAKQACATIIEQLRPEDKLSLASYSHQVDCLLNQVSGSNSQARQTIDQLTASGTTRMDLALNWLQATLSPEPGVMRVGILITDGHATTREGRLLEDLEPLLGQGTSLAEQGITLCSVGLGNAANFNTGFLVNLSERGQGAFLYADRPEDLTSQLEERLIACQSIVADEVTLSFQALAGAEVKGFCQFRPDYLPLEETAPNQLTLTGIRADQPTDVLLSVGIPSLSFGETPEPKTVLNITLEGAGLSTLSQDATIQYTNSFREAQTTNAEVNQDRLGWMMNQSSTELTRTNDPNRTGELLVDLQVTATQAGNMAIAQQAAQQLQNLQADGKLDAHQVTSLLQQTRQQGNQA
jgi:Ca-activated chloride channel family protein